MKCEAAARLNHPNVVAVLDADEDRGVHFLAMDYIEGRDLDSSRSRTRAFLRSIRRSTA